MSNDFTFHYVSILIILSRRQTLRCRTFTFHYVSILMQFALGIVQCAVFLYIPLCLYFNSVHTTYCNSMYILYIPLCLYFNNMVFNLHNCISLLYIPLCLYFNGIVSAAMSQTLYTLHSIMSLF